MTTSCDGADGRCVFGEGSALPNGFRRGELADKLLATVSPAPRLGVVQAVQAAIVATQAPTTAARKEPEFFCIKPP